MKFGIIFFTLITVSCSTFAKAKIPLSAWEKVEPQTFVVADPPKKGSDEYLQDYQELHHLQDTRSKAECSLAWKMIYAHYMQLFTPIDDDVLSDEQLTIAEPLMKKVTRFTLKMTGFYKKKYARKRPYDVDPTIEPCIKKVPGATSYPSSHASTSMAVACVFAKLLPKKSQAILDYGKEMGDLRVIVGVHHPSDVEAGQKLALDICDYLFSNEDFLKEAKALKLK